MSALHTPMPRPGALIRATQSWLIERRRRSVQARIDYLLAHRDDVDATLGWLMRERSRLSVARIELDRLP